MRIRAIKDPWWAEKAEGSIIDAVRSKPVWKSKDLLAAVGYAAQHIWKPAVRDTLAINMLATLEGSLVEWDSTVKLWRVIDETGDSSDS